MNSKYLDDSEEKKRIIFTPNMSYCQMLQVPSHSMLKILLSVPGVHHLYQKLFHRLYLVASHYYAFGIVAVAMMLNSASLPEGY